MITTSARRQARRRQLVERAAAIPRSHRARRLAVTTARALDLRLADDRKPSAILSMDLLQADPDDSGAGDVEFADSVHIDDPDPERARTMLETALRRALDGVDASGLAPSRFTEDGAWVRTFMTLSHGRWRLPRDVVERLARIRSTVWIDAS